MIHFIRGLHPAHDLATAVMLSVAAGVCSALGALLAVFLAGVHMPLHRLACSQAALGAALLFLGCCDLLPEAAAGISLFRALIFFIVGACGSAVTARLLRLRAITHLITTSPQPPPVTPRTVPPATPAPHNQQVTLTHANAPNATLHAPDVLVVGLVTFVSLSVHNLLEGMSILFAVREGLERGVRLATAISLENVPEGVCIALPLYFATRRKSLAVRMAFFSGMMEPLGVLLPGLFLNDYMTQAHISSALAIIAGILVFVALAEMLPLAIKTAETRTMAALSMWMGCGVLSATLFQPLLMYHARVGRVE